MPVVIVMAHSVVSYPRTFCYYTLILAMLTLLPYAKYFNALSTHRLIPILIFVQLMGCWNFFKVIRPYEERDPQVNMSSWDINKQIMGDKRFFCAGSLIGTNLRFELETRLGLKDRIKFQDQAVSADTLKGYDHIIIGRLFDSTKLRKPEYATAYFNVYRAE
jgi:hypothetical protein